MARILFLALDIDLGRNRGDTIHVLNLASCLADAGHALHLVVAAAAREHPIASVGVTRMPALNTVLQLKRRSGLAKTLRPEIAYERTFAPAILRAAARARPCPY